MNKRYLFLWLADELKPITTQKYFITSRGNASKDFLDTKTTVFLIRSQINNRYAYYESFYNIYELESKYLKIIKNTKYEENKIGDFLSICDDNNEINYIVFENDLYVFDFIGNIDKILSYLIIKYNINKIYSKKKIQEECEVIMFYFVDYKLSIENVFIQESSKNGLLGDFNKDNFYFGEFRYNLCSSKYPLLLWTRDNKEYENNLVLTNYYDFINEIKNIKEFDYSVSIKELSLVKNFGGEFYYLNLNNKIIGYVVLAKISDTFIYVSYLSLLKKYRKTGLSKKMMDSLKYLANQKKKNLILTIEVSKLLNFYQSYGFKSDGIFPFS